MKTIIKKLRHQWSLLSSDRFISFLQKEGVKIGNGCVFREPRTTRIDMTRPYLITIGNNVDMNRYFQIWTHDWASMVFIRKYGQMINSSGKVTIGDNIYFGTSVTILKGVTIGDNCVIGAGSIVCKDIPSNSVAVGNPCKVICTIDEYFEKRKKQALFEAVEMVKSFIERNGKIPHERGFIEESIFFKNQSTSQLPKVFDTEDEFVEYCIKNK